MRKSIWTPLIIILVVIVIAFIIGRLIYFGSGSGVSYTPPDVPLDNIPLEVAARSERITAADSPAVSRGVVVVDYVHDNALFIEELNTLFSKIVSRGYSYEIVVEGGSASEENSSSSAGEAGGELIEKLNYASAVILPLPRTEYTPEEVQAIENFVERGGRLFIIGDPTRTVVVEALNSIAGSFGIIYANDYLYSLVNNDNNYRNVVYTNFTDSPVTTGLAENGKVILYAASSINAPGYEIIMGDDTTFSSTSEGGRDMAAAALTTGNKVLAIGDLTFFTEPYSAAENNGTLINNIADFLTGGQPVYNVTSFPYFLNPTVDIVFNNPQVFNSQFENAVALKEFIENTQRTVNFADEIGSENDVVFIGRYGDDLTAIEAYLEAADITILEPDQKTEAEIQAEETVSTTGLVSLSDAPPEEDEERFIAGRIQIKGVGELERGGSSLFYRHQEDGRNIFIVLSDSPDTNADAFEILLENELPSCQATDQVAVCQTQDPDDSLPPSLRSNRIDKILVIADDDGRERENPQTGVLAYTNALSSPYKVDTWHTAEEGSPEIDQLLEYDAIIWTTGNYWDDSISEEDVELLTEYKRLGGNLILDGASIAFDWDHTDFLSDVAHADYLSTGEQTDLEVALVDHPISEGLDEGTVITLTGSTTVSGTITGTTPSTFNSSSDEELLIDIVSHTAEARVVFERGPDSEAEGAPSIIAYEDERVKIAYFAFPIYLLPAEAQVTLINNTVDWFTIKPLDLPDPNDYEPFELEGTEGEEEPAGEEPPADTGAGEEEGTDSGEEDTGQGEDNGGGEGEEGEGDNENTEEGQN